MMKREARERRRQRRSEGISREIVLAEGERRT
jgi:hypothetical protein